MFEQLGVDGWKLGIQAFNFLLLLLILQRFAFKPIVNMLDERSRRIRGDLDEARKLREEGERDRETYRQQLNRARDEARAVLEEANNVAARIREQAILDAEQQNAMTLQRARDEISREKEHAISELRREVGDLAIRVATKVVGRSLDGNDQQRLVDEALASVRTQSN
ncbi:MAG: F0F1 ATP synthase subunit B [Chloroflexota bacterium]